MKKLKLNPVKLGATKALTRTELRKVMGGNARSTTSYPCTVQGVPFPNTFCIPNLGGTDSPCSPGWPMGGDLRCPTGYLCCSLIS